MSERNLTEDEALARAVERLERNDKISAHGDGGGMKNDLTVSIRGMKRLNRSLVEEIRSLGYKLDSVGSGHPTKHDFDVLVTFEWVGDTDN